MNKVDTSPVFLRSRLGLTGFDYVYSGKRFNFLFILRVILLSRFYSLSLSDFFLLNRYSCSLSHSFFLSFSLRFTNINMYYINFTSFLKHQSLLFLSFSISLFLTLSQTNLLSIRFSHFLFQT